jgi:hypothetical protein
MLSMIKLNVTVYFTPEMPFIPPALTATPQKVVDVLQIMVVMTPDKSVSHLKQQIAKTISIVSKDENLPLSSNSNLCSIRNSQNYVAHNDMILGHAFIHNECIYAIILSDASRPFQYMASPASHIRPSGRRHVAVAHEQRQGSHHHRYRSNTNHVMPSMRNVSGSQNRRAVEGNRASQNDEHATTSEECNDSEDTYESSFVEKDDKEGFLDLEAEESDGNCKYFNHIGSVSSLNSPSPEYKGHSMSSSAKKLSLNELKRRRKNVIKVSESEDDLPTGFKSHSHYVASLIDKVKSNTENDVKMDSKEQINDESRSDFKDDKEIDDSIVRKDIENNQSNPVPQSKLKAIISSDESSESSEQEMREQVAKNQTNQIARDIESDSESDSESSSSSTSGSQNDLGQEVSNEAQQNNALKEEKIETAKATEASNSRSESDETEDGLEMNAESSKIPKKLSKKSSKRKYSSLSEIASNTSNHSTSSKPETQKKQSSSSSPSSSSSESDPQEKKGKRVKSSSLRSLSKDGIFITFKY